MLDQLHLDSGSPQGLDLVGAGAVVSDDRVDPGGGADEGEGRPAELGAVTHDDDVLGGLDQCGVDGRLPVVLRVGAPLIKSLDSQEERAHTDRGKDERARGAGELEGTGLARSPR